MPSYHSNFSNLNSSGSKGALFSLALITALSITSPALAQDEDAFSGFRIEAITGYDDTGIDFDDDFNDGGKQSQSGIIYGAVAGYDFRTGPVAIGIEGEFSDATSGDEGTIQGTAPDGLPFTANVNVDTGGEFYVGARVGYVVSPAALVYLKGGYSHTTIDIDGGGTKGAVPFTFDDGASLDGFRLGVGSEIMISESIYGKIEYRYSNYTDGDFDIGSNDVNLNALFENVDVVRHQVGIGLGIRF